MAGPELTLRALHHHTARLPLIEFNTRRVRGVTSYGSTRSAMLSGAGVQTLGAVSAAVSAHESHAKKPLQTFVTGGWAGPLAGYFPSTWRIEPDLVMQGLELLWKLNND